MICGLSWLLCPVDSCMLPLTSCIFTWELKWKWSESQLCPTLCDPMDYTIHRVLQARILEWVVAFPFSRGSSQPRDWTQVSCIAGGSLPAEPQGSPRMLEWVAYPFFSGSPWPRNWTGVSCIADGFFTSWAIREAPTGVSVPIWVVSNSGQASQTTLGELWPQCFRSF